MNCPSCGRGNFAWAKACDHCHAPMGGAAPPDQAGPAPSTPSATPSPAHACTLEHMDPAVRDAQVRAVSDRTRQIAATETLPEWFFVCQVGEGTLALPTENKTQSLLFFTSPILADDYLRAIGEQGVVGGIRVTDLAAFARGLADQGARTFCINRCPRCQVMLAIKLSALDSPDQLLKVWALERAGRFLKGQGFARAVFEAQSRGVVPMRAAVETLRDHAAADNPYVYKLLIFIATVQHDEALKAEAITRWNQLAPGIPATSGEEGRDLAEGIVGLLKSFELLNLTPAAT